MCHAGLLCGTASGFGSMIANAGAPTFQIYVMPQRLPPAVYVGTSVIFFAVTNWHKVIPYAMLGQLGPANLLTSAVMLPVAILSTWLGIWLIRRMSSAKFYPVLNGLLFLVGLRLTWTALRGYGCSNGAGGCIAPIGVVAAGGVGSYRKRTGGH